MLFLLMIVYLVFVLIRPHEWGDQGVTNPVPVIFLTMMVAGAFFLFKKNKRFDAGQPVLFTGMLVAIIFSWVTQGWFGGALNSIEKFGSQSFIPFVLLAAAVDSQRKQRVIIWLFCVAAALMVYNGITQRASDIGQGWVGNFSDRNSNRITWLGFFNDPNDLGMYFVMLIPLVFYMSRRALKVFRPLFYLFVVFLMYGIYLTNSRGTLLGFLAICGLWLLFRYGWFKSAVVGVTALPVIYLVLSRFREIDAEESSAEGRLDAWYEGFQMAISNPVFGVGFGGFTDHHTLTAHNSYVLVLAELGTVGYMFWALALSLAILMLIKIRNFDLAPLSAHYDNNQIKVIEDERAVASALLFSMIGYAVTAFFLSRSYAPIYYIYQGLVVASYYRFTSLVPEFPRVNIKGNLGALSKWSIGFIVAVYVATKLFL